MSTRRLPGPVLIERWLPMQTQARFGAIPRTAIILVTLGLLAALLTAIAVASQPSHHAHYPALVRVERSRRIDGIGVPTWDQRPRAPSRVRHEGG